MEVKVTRKTGLMGFALNVILEIDNGRQVRGLDSSESYRIRTDQETVKIKAAMWFFGSKQIEVTRSSVIEIKTNPLALFMYFGSFVLIFLGGFNNYPGEKLVLLLVGLIGVIVTIIYSINNWFVFRDNKGEKIT